jgi:cell division septum initiation protein DivIVA
VTDHTLARADEVLTELVELVETARTLPMSSSCVVPRERTLDLLDALREVLPPEMIEARKLVAERDRVLTEADALAEQTRRDSTAEAEALVKAARIEAHELLEGAREEQAQLLAASTIHQTASEQAAALTEQTRIDTDRIRAEADAYAARLGADAHSYAERTLSDLVANLTRLAATAENGRAALAQHDPGRAASDAADSTAPVDVAEAAAQRAELPPDSTESPAEGNLDGSSSAG